MWLCIWIVILGDYSVFFFFSFYPYNDWIIKHTRTNTTHWNLTGYLVAQMKRGVGSSSGRSEVWITPVLSQSITVNEIHSIVHSHTSIIIMIFMSVFICIVLCVCIVLACCYCYWTSVCVCTLCVYNVLTLWSVNLPILVCMLCVSVCCCVFV